MVLEDVLAVRRRYRGLIGYQPKLPIRDSATLSLVYTPGVAKPCLEIADDHMASFDYTIRGNTVAVISDGSSVYGLGNVGPLASIPMLEAKCGFHKTFAGIDALPIAIDTTDPDEFVEVVRYLSPTFGGIHLEDIASPLCFTIEERLKRAISLPIFHTDQQGASVAVWAGLTNALKVIGKEPKNLKIVINGAGAAGIATARMLVRHGVGDVKVCDRHGVLYYRRLEGLNWVKSEVARLTNRDDVKGGLIDVIKGADVFIGCSAGNTLTPDMVKTMAKDPIIFALAVPNPEITVEAAREAGAKIIATGRSDYANQLNASLVFPGIFRGALDVRSTDINNEMFDAAAEAIASLVSDKELSSEMILPRQLDLRLSAAVAKAVAKKAMQTGAAQVDVNPDDVESKVMNYVYEGTNAWIEPQAVEEYASNDEEALDLHRRYHGVIEMTTKVPIRDHFVYDRIYSSPEAAIPCAMIRDNPDEAWDLTVKSNLVAVVTDGSAVLGLGNLGPQGAMPVMEGKAVLFKTFGAVEAFPICLRTQEVDEIVDTVCRIAPVFGGINLEDISAPRCFEVERKLSEMLDIPIFHDDQHGTAVVALAGVLNAVKVVDKKLSDIKIVMNGAGASSLSVARLLMKAGAENIIICDTKGAIYQGRQDGMNFYKEQMAEITNAEKHQGQLADVMQGADLFIGLSGPDTVTPDMVRAMSKEPIVMAMANPTPEIMPDLACEAGARVVATGRSDFPNQVNNSLAFPGIFRGALDVRARRIDDEMKLAAARAIASLVTEEELEQTTIIPSALDFRVPPAVAEAVAAAAIASGQARIHVDPHQVARGLKQYIYEGDFKKQPELSKI